MGRFDIGADADRDYLLDPQQSRPAGWCPRCGAEIWDSGKVLCSRCERSAGLEPTVKEFQHVFIVTASTPRLRGLRAFLDINNYQYSEEVAADG